MPLYEYRCRICGEEFELLVRSSDVPSCPSCRSAAIERLLSSFAVNSQERSKATLAKARKRYQQSRTRQERLRHEAEEVREHVRDDYGIDLGEKAPVKPAS